MMQWLEDYRDDNITDDNAKLLYDFNLFKNYLDVPKENIMFLEAKCKIKEIESAIFARNFIENINLQDDVNIVMWVCSEMTHTSEGGPWTRLIYRQNEEKMLKAVRQIAEHLKIPSENALFLVPGDEFQKEKISEFVCNFLEKFDSTRDTAMVWFKCKDKYHPRAIKRMLT
jgi:hypothetical protein